MSFTICGTRNAKEGISEGAKILSTGGSALEAVEKSIRIVEEDLNDWTVGRGGFPNLKGYLELDAGIMVGSTLETGAVAGVRNYSNVISLAKDVMTLSPHVLLIGEGAENFARALNYEKTELLTEEMKLRWQAVLDGKSTLLGTDTGRFKTLAEFYDSYLKFLLEQFPYKEWYEKLTLTGTVNVIAREKYGEIVVGVSTSGLALKLPGRVGDSPIAGAGFYATSDGAAACVGAGELVIRLSSSRIAIHEINTLPIQEIANNRIEELNKLNSPSNVQILVMNSIGEVAAATNAPKERKSHFFVMNEDDSVPRKVMTPIISK
ncbi:MAG: isoaspartyl peptidase/L-asparaginase [Candidatus Hodarchaeales archaeon]|jgi:beta-aspartyl-peptidase (threonine type)